MSGGTIRISIIRYMWSCIGFQRASWFDLNFWGLPWISETSARVVGGCVLCANFRFMIQHLTHSELKSRSKGSEADILGIKTFISVSLTLISKVNRTPIPRHTVPSDRRGRKTFAWRNILSANKYWAAAPGGWRRANGWRGWTNTMGKLDSGKGQQTV